MTDRSQHKSRSISVASPNLSPVIPVGSWKKARAAAQSKSSFRSPSRSPNVWRQSQLQVPHLINKFVVIGILVLLAGTTWLLWPVGSACLTQQFTSCSSEEREYAQTRFPRRFSALVADQGTLTLQFQQNFIEIEEVRVKVGAFGANSVILTRSQPIATVKVGSSWYQVLSAGQRKPVSTESYPSITFASDESWQTWINSYGSNKEAAATLEVLARQTSSFHPRITTIQVLSSDEVVLRLENTSRVVLSLHTTDEIKNQLRTLQAVFSASTIEQRPTEVDVRFKNVIIRN